MNTRTPEDRPRKQRPHLPPGCDAQKTTTVETMFGAVQVRVRRYSWTARVHHLDRLSAIHGANSTMKLVHRYEVAVETERCRRERVGYQVLTEAWHDGSWREPGSLLEVLLQAAQMVERAEDQHKSDLAEQLEAERAVALASADVTAAEDRAPARGTASRPKLRRVPPAETSWEGLRRLLNARCNQLEKITGELASETRHEAAEFASGDRVVRGVGGAVRSSKQLTTDELRDAVSWVEDKLHRAGFDFEADQAGYEDRCRQRDELVKDTSTKRAA